MKWLLRLLVLGGGLIAALVLSPAPARAEIVYTDGAKSEFEIDADGNPTGDGDGGTLTNGWSRFWLAPEGQRIHSFLDGLEGVTVVVDVLPADEVGSGDSAGKVYGTARVVERDDVTGRPTEVIIKIRNERTGGADNLADTIWHEFRHTEIWVHGGGEDDHDDLDAEDSTRNEVFRKDVEQVVSTSTTLDPNPPTPHFDRIMRDAGDNDLESSAWLLGDILEDLGDSINWSGATFESEYVDLEWYGAGKYGYDAAGVTLTFNESIFECGEASDGRRVVCAEGGVLPMPAGEVAVLAMVLADEIPQTGGDHSLVYSAVFDSDADPANDWVFVPPFDMDYFQGTDRWYQLLYDHTADSWRLVVTQLSPDGEMGGASEPSTVRAVVEGDTVVFLISMDEFSAAEPGYRLTAFGHDGFFSEADRGGDVSGRLPDEPPLPLERGTVPVSPG